MNLYNSGYARLVGEDSYFSNVISNQMIGGYIGSCTGVSYITADGWELGVAPVPGNKEKAGNQAGVQHRGKQAECCMGIHEVSDKR